MALQDGNPVQQYDFAVNDNQIKMTSSVNSALMLDPNPLDIISIGDPRRSIQQLEDAIGHTPTLPTAVIAHDSFARPQQATSAFSGSVAFASAQTSNFPQCPTTSSSGRMHAPSPPANGQLQLKLASSKQTKTLLIGDEMTVFDQKSCIRIYPIATGKAIHVIDCGFLWIESLRPEIRYKIFEARIFLHSTHEHPHKGFSEKRCKSCPVWNISKAMHNGRQWEAFYGFLVHALVAKRIESCAYYLATKC
ncbi:hypothetical protein BKA63DRAFT_551218 [Paraphoma chrysanthemicola]|nr:hypothetical protein BKA63DRAFT_551218 [Paraphoma chrysanthemicola]